eukprot:scaffold14337_cov132-Isochrysis_galbana.AAC.1
MMPQSMAVYGGDFELVFVDILFKYDLHSHFTYHTDDRHGHHPVLAVVVQLTAEESSRHVAGAESEAITADEIIGVGDEVWVVPFFHCLLLNGRRWWWGLAFALLRRDGVERGEFVCLFVGSVGLSVRSVCCLSLALSLPWRVMRGLWCGSFRA